MERNYADVDLKPATASSNEMSGRGKRKSTKTVQSSFRKQRISENQRKSRNENFVPRNEKLIELVNFPGVGLKNEQWRRLRSFDKDRCRPRTLLVIMTNEYDVRLKQARSAEKRDLLIQQNVLF